MSTLLTVRLIDCRGHDHADLCGAFETALVAMFGGVEKAKAAYDAYETAISELGAWPSEAATPEQERAILEWEQADSAATAEAFGNCGWGGDIPDAAHFHVSFWDRAN